MKYLVVVLLAMCSLAAHAQYVATPPLSPDSYGIAGQYAGDVNYFYMAIGQNTWKRIPWDATWKVNAPVALATDDFNRTGDGVYGQLNGNWTSRWGLFNWRIYNNELTTYCGGGAYIATTTILGFMNDQYAEAKTTSHYSVNAYMGIVVRGDSQSPVMTGYGLSYTNAIGYTLGIKLFKITGAGATVTLAQTTSTAGPGSVLRLEARGNTLTAYLNGTPLLSATDSTYTSGTPGIVGEGTNTTTVDDWSAGNL